MATLIVLAAWKMRSPFSENRKPLSLSCRETAQNDVPLLSRTVSSIAL